MLNGFQWASLRIKIKFSLSTLFHKSIQFSLRSFVRRLQIFDPSVILYNIFPWLTVLWQMCIPIYTYTACPQTYNACASCQFLMHIGLRWSRGKYNAQHMSLCHNIFHLKFKFLRISYICIIFTSFLPLLFHLRFLLNSDTSFDIHDLFCNYYCYIYICMCIHTSVHAHVLLSLFNVAHIYMFLGWPLRTW